MNYERRFAGVAGAEYELFRLAVPHHDRFQELISEEVAKLAGTVEDPALQVVDIGCGYGYTSLLLHTHNPNIEITGIDNEEVVTNKAREYLANEVKSGKINILTCDALEFLRSQEDESIHCVVSAWVFHNWEHQYRDDTLKETFRVLKRGGIFVNADKYAWDNGDQQTEALYWQIEKFFDAYLPMNRTDALREWVLHYILDEAPKIQMKEGQAFSQMKAIGFSKLNVLRREQMELVLCAEKQ